MGELGMSVRQYIGARYVPLLMGEWSDEVTYEPLSIVLHEGNSYTSRQAVPLGIPITNTTFWAPTGNYNAQIEYYRQAVAALADDVHDMNDMVPASEFDEQHTVKDYIDGEVSDLGDLLPASSFSTSNTVEDEIDKVRDVSFDQSKYIDKAVFFGDSVTYGDLGTIGGQQQGRAAKPYPTVYGENACIATIDNRAVNGSTSLSLPDIADAYNFSTADQVFIAHGCNDWAYSTKIGSPFRQNIDTTTFCGCLNYTIQKVLAGNPKCEIIICTPFYAQSSGTEFTNSPGALSENALGFNIEDYANAARAVANVNNLKCIDMRESLGINNINHSTWINDDVHPNQDGYTMIGEWLYRQVSFASNQSSVTAMKSYVPNGCNFIGPNDFTSNNTTPFSPFGDGMQAGQVVVVNNSYSLSNRYYRFDPNKVYTFQCTIRATSGYHLLIQLNRYTSEGYVKILERTPHIVSTDHAYTVSTQFTVPVNDLFRLDINELSGSDVYVTDISITEGMVGNPNIGCSEYDYTIWEISNRNASLSNVSGIARIKFNVQNGRTYLFGTQKVTANIAEDSLICTVPKCYAPNSSQFFYGVNNNKDLVKFEIMNTGNVYLRDTLATDMYFTIDTSWTYRRQSVFTECDVVSNQA